ncbi:MAG TPA: hypothetical protein VMT52_05565 [Planctomycetota bacterium]|nr:hypothetical protein [Planctomycetota bacterium]
MTCSTPRCSRAHAPHRVRNVILLAAALGAGPASSTAHACQVPVFRYALERWESSPYEVVLLHVGPLRAEEEALIARLRALGLDGVPGTPGPANFHVKTLDSAAPPDSSTLPLEPLRGQVREGAPLLALRAPPRAEDGPAGAVLWTGPLSARVVEAIADSPARREVARRILGGESAVWVLIESGDAAKDDEAWRTLERESEALEKTLKLPDMEAIRKDAEYNADTAISLRLAFSTLRVSRGDEREELFIACLESVEPDLASLRQEPIALPVFGRGRALYGLTGKGIHADTIREACALLVGPCACTIKEQNPGCDIILAADWKGGIEGSVVPPPVVPDLPGLPSRPAEVSSSEIAVEGYTVPPLGPDRGESGTATSVRSTDAVPLSGASSAREASVREPGLLVPILIAAGAGLIIAAIGTLLGRARGR